MTLEGPSWRRVPREAPKRFVASSHSADWDLRWESASGVDNCRVRR